MLADNRGKFVPFKDQGALAREINYLLDHPEERLTMRRAAYQYCPADGNEGDGPVAIWNYFPMPGPRVRLHRLLLCWRLSVSW